MNFNDLFNNKVTYKLFHIYQPPSLGQDITQGQF